MAVAKTGDATETATETTKDFTVAKGRTVHADKEYGPGETVSLTEDEGKRLQKLGFLVSDDGETVIDESAGPAVVQGAEIKES